MFSTATLAWMAFALATPFVAGMESAANCSRRALSLATDRYRIAQSTGELGWLNSVVSPNVTYWENLVELDPTGPNSTLRIPLRIDYSRTSFDMAQCATFTELLSTDPEMPYQIGMQIRMDPATRKIVKLDSIVTTTGDFYLNPSHTLYYTLHENWGTISRRRRDSREVLQAVADSYYDVFVNKSVQVPWGKPCTRVLGGYLDADGDCNTDIPDVTVRTVDRRYVIDESLGIVNVISNFGILGPDSHEFRIVNGTIRQIHSMTLCRPVANCGVEMPAIVSQDIGF